MPVHSPIARLVDIIEAVELISSEMRDVTLGAFAKDRRKQWLVERGVEIISEASRRLPEALKLRHPEIHGRKSPVSAIYCGMNTSMSRMTCFGIVVHDELPVLEKICRDELVIAHIK